MHVRFDFPEGSSVCGSLRFIVADSTDVARCGTRIMRSTGESTTLVAETENGTRIQVSLSDEECRRIAADVASGHGTTV